MKYKISLNIVILSLLFFSPSFSQNNTGLLVYNKSKVSSEDYILYYDGYLCRLLDRDGNVLFDFPGAYSQFTKAKNEIICAMKNYIVAYNKDFDILWKYHCAIHHELIVTPENHIMALSSEYDSINNISMRFDVVVCLDSTGKELYKWSTCEQREYLMNYMMKDTNIFQFKIKGSLNPDSVLFKITPSLTKKNDKGIYYPTELFHSNTIQVIPSNEAEKIDTVFRKGNILLSFHNTHDILNSFIAVVDPINYKILWHYVQKDRKPIHTPAMLPNGHILMYVNAVRKYESDSSLIEEINPITKEVVWSYVEKFPWGQGERGSHGSCQRLQNGNTLISNLDGYIYEVTPDKNIVWSFNVGKNTKLYKAYMFPKDFFTWLFINEK